MMGLPYGAEIMIVGRTVWTQSTSVTDRETDGRTDRITITKTVQRRASHGKKKQTHRQIDRQANKRLVQTGFYFNSFKGLVRMSYNGTNEQSDGQKKTGCRLFSLVWHTTSAAIKYARLTAAAQKSG